MGGGLMQLVAYGAQDVYLTGNPQITFFKVVYRRHTNFSMESIQQTLNGQHTLGQRLTATISRNGDLISSMYLQMKFTGCSAATRENVGHGCLESVAVEIGGQLIDKQYGEWMDIWIDLTLPSSKIEGFNDMAHSSGETRTVKVPLHFWFCRNPGLALPLIALQYHEVKVIVNFGSESDVGSGTTLSNAELWVDYIYLDTDERRRFAQVSHEYLIEQLQFSGALASASTNQHHINFNHPVKEILWVERKDSTAPNWRNWTLSTEFDDDIKLMLNGHDRWAGRDSKYFTHYQTYQHHTRIPTGYPGIIYAKAQADGVIGAADEAAGQTVVTLGADPTATALGLILHVTDDPTDYVITGIAGADVTISPALKQVAKKETVVSFNHKHTDNVSPRNIHCYSFALKPEEHQPSGTCNFSRIDNATLKRLGTADSELHIYAVNYNVLRIMSGMGGLAYSN